MERERLRAKVAAVAGQRRMDESSTKYLPILSVTSRHPDRLRWLWTVEEAGRQASKPHEEEFVVYTIRTSSLNILFAPNGIDGKQQIPMEIS